MKTFWLEDEHGNRRQTTEMPGQITIYRKDIEENLNNPNHLKNKRVTYVSGRTDTPMLLTGRIKDGKSMGPLVEVYFIEKEFPTEVKFLEVIKLMDYLEGDNTPNNQFRPIATFDKE